MSLLENIKMVHICWIFNYIRKEKPLGVLPNGFLVVVRDSSTALRMTKGAFQSDRKRFFDCATAPLRMTGGSDGWARGISRRSG